jgi:hypothetical protein
MRFHAALEVRAQQLVLWCLAALVRCGLPLRVADWSGALERLARVFEPLGGIHGGMRVSVLGTGSHGQRLRRSWLLTAPSLHGPEIPCLAAILLVRRLAKSTPLPAGAMPAAGVLTLVDFAPAFAHWGIHTEIRDEQP